MWNATVPWIQVLVVLLSDVSQAPWKTIASAGRTPCQASVDVPPSPVGTCSPATDRKKNMLCETCVSQSLPLRKITKKTPVHIIVQADASALKAALLTQFYHVCQWCKFPC